MKQLLFVFALLVCPAAFTQAGDWQQWRGPHHNGSSDETGLPTKWSKTENIAWSATLPGPSAATPIVSGDRVFISSTAPDSDTLVALCLSRENGKVLWSRDVGKGIGKDPRSYFSAPSPVTDGKLVFFFYGNGEMVALDIEGEKQWSKNFGPFAFLWTFSTTPLLYDGKLYLQVLQRDTAVKGSGERATGNESYLLAIDPKSGETLWRAERKNEAVAESREAFSSPVPYEFDGKTQILVVGGDALSGHDPKTGKELWRWGTWNPDRIGHWRLVPSPVAGGGVILACAPKKNPIYAIKAGGMGPLDDSSIAWTSKDSRTLTSDVPTPAFYDGNFFVLSKSQRAVSRVEPQTGKIKWSTTLESRAQLEASPLAADGKIYTLDFDGTVNVLNAKSGEIINTIEMGDEPRTKDIVRSSIVAAHGQLYIRTNQKLYCVGK